LSPPDFSQISNLKSLRRFPLAVIPPARRGRGRASRRDLLLLWLFSARLLSNLKFQICNCPSGLRWLSSRLPAAGGNERREEGSAVPPRSQKEPGRPPPTSARGTSTSRGAMPASQSSNDQFGPFRCLAGFTTERPLYEKANWKRDAGRPKPFTRSPGWKRNCKTCR
jgi:hypothetical protein